mmetsp:Transcript_10229/g.43046  ORF Transcript_10229/g.43046 Transcript_10229/m.43046 type:complete len:332 (+) Transcript_10229:468-1463(+)
MGTAPRVCKRRFARAARSAVSSRGSAMPRNVSADDDTAAFFSTEKSREGEADPSFSPPPSEASSSLSARSAPFFSSVGGFSLSSVGLVAVAGALVSAPSVGPSSASTAARRRGRRARRRAKAAASSARSAVPFCSPSRRAFVSDAKAGAPQRASVAKSSSDSSFSSSSSAKASPLLFSSAKKSAPPKHATSAPGTRRASRHAAASARATEPWRALASLSASAPFPFLFALFLAIFPLLPSQEESVALRSAARTHARLVCKKTRSASVAPRFSAATSAASASATSETKLVSVLFKRDVVTSARPERAAREICARNDSRSGACCLTRGNARTT